VGVGEELLAIVKRIEAKVDALSKGGGASTESAVAPDSDLDSEWGDEEIKKDPPRWKGESKAPCHMSETSAEYLDEYASFKDYCAERDTEKANELGTTGNDEETAKKLKYAGYGRKSARRARGWAARLRAGWKPATQAAGGDW
jgi:hypothetical protein